MTDKAKKILIVRLTLVVVFTLAYVILAALEFHKELVGSVAVVLIIAAMFVPVPGERTRQS